MPDFAIYLGFLLAGLAGSLHCIGMCGPILIGATNMVGVNDLRIEGNPIQRLAHRAVSQIWYHVGRLLTYIFLGALAGGVGQTLIEKDWFDESQHYLGLGAAGVAIAFGIGMLYFRFRQRKRKSDSDGATEGRCARVVSRYFRGIAATPSIEGKLLLGVLMGFLPCGLVYSMLALTAATGSASTASIGMAAFGLGTIPALSGVVIASGMLPIGIRKYGEYLAAIIIIAIGSFMMWRAWPHGAEAAAGACPMCAPSEVDS